MNNNFKIANRVSTREVANCVSGKEYGHLRFARKIPDGPQGILLGYGQTVFQQINVIRHASFTTPCGFMVPAMVLSIGCGMA